MGECRAAPVRGLRGAARAPPGLPRPGGALGRGSARRMGGAVRLSLLLQPRQRRAIQAADPSRAALAAAVPRTAAPAGSASDSTTGGPPALEESTMQQIEHIEDGGRPLAVILRAEDEPASIEFLTTDDQSLQLGVMRRPPGYVIAPHITKPAQRTVEYTYEALFIVRGRVEVTFFNERRAVVTKRELRQGDCGMLMTVGHGFRAPEGCTMLEADQGAYARPDLDEV